jgi:hypothetical protein
MVGKKSRGARRCENGGTGSRASEGLSVACSWLITSEAGRVCSFPQLVDLGKESRASTPSTVPPCRDLRVAKSPQGAGNLSELRDTAKMCTELIHGRYLRTLATRANTVQINRLYGCRSPLHSAYQPRTCLEGAGSQWMPPGPEQQSSEEWLRLIYVSFPGPH